MVEEYPTFKYPHKHLLGIEGLLPNSIEHLLGLSDKFVDHLNNKKNEKLNFLKNKICINLFLRILHEQERHSNSPEKNLVLIC